MTLALLWLACAALFLEACHRAPEWPDALPTR